MLTPQAARVQGEAFVDNEVKLGAVVTPISTPSVLSWVKTPVLPTSLASVYQTPEYSVTRYDNSDLALKALGADWSSELPSFTPSSVEARYLWVRLVHRTTDALSVAVNLTDSSGIRSVVANANEDAARAFLMNELAPAVQVEATRSNPGSLVWKSAVPVLPTAVALNYEIPEFAKDIVFKNERAARASSESGLWVPTLPTSINSRIDKRAFWARLKPKVPNLNVLAINLTDSSDLADVRETRVFVELSARTFLDNDLSARLSVNLTSSRFPNVVWNTYDLALPDELYDYYDIEFRTNAVTTYIDDKQAAQDRWPWPIKLPPTIIEGPGNITDPAKLRLWVRLESRDQAAYSSVALEITNQSKINQILAA